MIRSERQSWSALVPSTGLCLALGGVLGCEAWIDVDVPQCKTDRDCVGLLGRGYACASGGVCLPPDGGIGTSASANTMGSNAGAASGSKLPARWACAEQKRGDFVGDPDRTVTIRMDAVDLNTLRVPPGLQSSACNPTDFGCDTPLIEDAKPGGDGFFEYVLPYGWEGYLLFAAPDIVPALSMTNKPYLESQTTSGPALLTFKAQKDLSEHSGDPIEPGTGIVIFEVRDCNDTAGDGISFDPVADQTPFYFDGALPARTLKATMVSNLLAAGRESRAVAGFANLPPSYLGFQARLASNGSEIMSFTAPIRADTITYVRVYAGY